MSEKKFKVLFVYPNLQMVMLLPTNIGVLAAYLKNSGIDVKVFDTTLYRTSGAGVDDIRTKYLQVRPVSMEEKGVRLKRTDVFEDFRRIVDEYDPDVLAVSVTDDTYKLGIGLISQTGLKKRHVIVGGVRATFSPEEVIANDAVDSVCLGEGEEALLELCIALRDGKDTTGIKNLWIKKDGKIFRNGVRGPIDITTLPREDFSVFDDNRLYRPMGGRVYRMLPVTMDRGCPFSCSFCAAPAIRSFYQKNGHGAAFRVKKADDVIAEIKEQARLYEADYIYFNSETFFAGNKGDFRKFAGRYAKEIGLPFWCQTRVETITEDSVRILRDMGCDRMSVGLEHGNELFRKKVLRKEFSNEDFLKAFDILNKTGIHVTVNNVVGFPDETRELAFDTIKLNRSVSPGSVSVYVFVPYRGTPLREYCISRGYLDPRHTGGNLVSDSVLNMPFFTKDEIMGVLRTFPLYVRMPEEMFGKIGIAEKPGLEGDSMFSELSKIYINRYC